jgi:hypothetical protein
MRRTASIGIAVMGLLLLLAGSVSAQDVTGCYANAGTKDRDFSYGTSLVLHQKGASKMEFHYQEVGAHGDLCVAHGIANRDQAEPAKFLFEARGGGVAVAGDPGFACSIRISLEVKDIVIEQTGGDCGGHFGCGAHTGVADRFVRGSRKALGRRGCDMPKP